MTRQPLEISFNSPQCGWMSIGFDDGVSEFHTTTAHAPHNLALPELLRMLTSLLEEAESEYLLKWNRDPEEFDFHFVRNGGDLRLQIFQFPTDERVIKERELVFTHRGHVGEVLAAFGATFEQLYQDRETDEFEFNWRQPFPFDEFTAFRSKLAEYRIG